MHEDCLYMKIDQSNNNTNHYTLNYPQYKYAEKD